jgi:hypothetical protein
MMLKLPVIQQAIATAATVSNENNNLRIKREDSMQTVHVPTSVSSALPSTLGVKSAALSVQHSRNACKKLKCPKCNWHYKYRETLDIHMREKHGSDASSENMAEQCMYCVDSLPHPRLGRGEQYKCGYKPYRCDICDYSTTTKGNLSIHMQSDKHVNNVKEMKEKGENNSLNISHSESSGVAGEQHVNSSEEFFENSGSNLSSRNNGNSSIGGNNTKKIKDIYTSTFSLTSINSPNGKICIFFLFITSRNSVFERLEWNQISKISQLLASFRIEIK